MACLAVDHVADHGHAGSFENVEITIESRPADFKSMLDLGIGEASGAGVEEFDEVPETNDTATKAAVVASRGPGPRHSQTLSKTEVSADGIDLMMKHFERITEKFT